MNAVANLKLNIDNAKKVLGDFQSKVGEDAHEAFYWSADAIAAAAALRVYKQALAWIEGGNDAAAVEGLAMCELRHRLGVDQLGGSPIDVMLRSEALRAWVRVADICHENPR